MTFNAVSGVFFFVVFGLFLAFFIGAWMIKDMTGASERVARLEWFRVPAMLISMVPAGLACYWYRPVFYSLPLVFFFTLFLWRAWIGRHKRYSRSQTAIPKKLDELERWKDRPPPSAPPGFGVTYRRFKT